MKILYGINNNTIDVTTVAFDKCVKQNILYIPDTDIMRAELFTDPLYNILKYIFIVDDNLISTTYDHTQAIYIDLTNNNIYTNMDIYMYPQSFYLEVK